MSCRTIFITSFFGLIGRNILSTDTLSILRRRKDLRIVIFTPKEKEVLYRDTFGSNNIIVEGISSGGPPSKLKSFMASVFLNSSDTAARHIHRVIEREQYEKYVRSTFHWFLAKLSRLRFYRRWLRYCDHRLSSWTRFSEYFEKYSPDLIFVTDIFEPDDVELAREARSRGVYVLGMIRSWDNVTTKGLNRIVTDKLAVNTPRIKSEAIKYCDFQKEDITVVGVPHYDAYTEEKRISKELLFKQLNLDSVKKTVFFAAPSDIYTQGDSITEKIVNLLLSTGVQVILRLYIVGHVNLGKIKPIPGRLAIDDPGSGNDFIAADLTGKDAHLADLIYHSDVVVAFASTLAIDAMVFGKPVIFVGFDAVEGRPYWQSLRRFYDYNHQRDLLKSGGVRLARSPQDLANYLKVYLADPAADFEGRKRIIAERCWKLDGGSGKRLAEVILGLIYNGTRA